MDEGICKYMKFLLKILFFTFAICLSSCQHVVQYPAELLIADSLCFSNPDSAMVYLEGLSVDIPNYREPAQRYYQLLTIKAQDKAFISHTSDSLILDVVSYYEDGGDPGLLPEAYYYAGRVYRDLGDAPQALDYFHKALDAYELPAFKRATKGKEHASLLLKGKIYAQMGYLFRRQNLFNEAIKSFEQAFNVDSIVNDTTTLIYDLGNLGDTYRHLKDYSKAISLYDKSYFYAAIRRDTSNLLNISIQKAFLYNIIGDYEKALLCINEYSLVVTTKNFTRVNSILARIYANTNQKENAAECFQKIISSNDIYARANANLWLGKYACDKGNDKEALYYFRQYMQYEDSIKILENNEATTLSQSLYNYQLKEKEISILKIREISLKAQSWMFIALATIACLLFYFEHTRRCKIKRQNDYLQLIIATNKKQHEDRQKFESKVNFKNNEVYKRIRDKCDKKQSITKAEWKEIELLFETAMPDFIPKLRGIHSLNRTEWELSLLSKMDFSWSEIALLVNLSYDAIHSSQSRLYKKVFKNNVTYKNWREFINSL